ncbi:MAG TPA: hypothetical protein VGB77_22950 [Abditibacteriaceae bacterium]|jgi:hypothetical protein
MKTFQIAVAILCVLAPMTQAKTIKICFEAESAATVKPPLLKVVPGINPLYSGKGYIDIPMAAPAGAGSATYKINVVVAGNYYLFARTLYAPTAGNSILVWANGQKRILGEDGTYGAWHWTSNKTPVRLKKGTNIIALVNRESGVRIDQFFLTNNSRYEPVGLRRITHDGTGKPLNHNIKSPIRPAAR